jgi:hypothetical protein
VDSNPPGVRLKPPELDFNLWEFNSKPQEFELKPWGLDLKHRELDFNP